MAPNRLVAILTPIVFAPLAGAVSAWLADNVPGVSVSPDQLQAVFIAGALVALAPAIQWLHGWQKYEARQAENQQAIALANTAAPVPVVATAAPLEIQPMDELDELDEAEDPDDALEIEELDELDGLEEFEDLEDLDGEPAGQGAATTPGS